MYGSSVLQPGCNGCRYNSLLWHSTDMTLVSGGTAPEGPVCSVVPNPPAHCPLVPQVGIVQCNPFDSGLHTFTFTATLAPSTQAVSIYAVRAFIVGTGHLSLHDLDDLAFSVIL